MVNQYNYLGLTFIPYGKKKHVDIDNLKNKERKAWVSIQKMLHKSKGKTADTYIKFFDSTVKSTILYASECWGGSSKDTFADKIEKFYLGILKQILGVNKKVNGVKVLTEH